MGKKKLVLIGNGMAGVYCIEQLLKLAPDRYEITIIGKEPYPNYNRIQLSSVLAGDSSIKEIIINDWSWYEEHQITLHTGKTVTNIDGNNKLITMECGMSLPYDECIIATGSHPFMLPLPGADKEGVIAFRDIKDCETMVESSKKYKRAVVIGGGLLGLEAARGLLNLNMEVFVVHLHHSLMERQLDETAGIMLQKELEKQGMKFLMSKQSEAILGNDRVEALQFKDGSKVEADLLVMAVGIKPNVDVALKSDIEVNRGIVVNDWLETKLPHVYAIGECAEHRGIAYGLVAPLYEQGNILAKRLAGVETEGYQGSVVSTKLKVSGVDVFSAGDYSDGVDTSSVRVQDDFAGVYKKIVVKDGKMLGAILFGDTSEGSSLFSMIRKGEDISGRESEILLGSSSGSGQSGIELVAAMDNDEIICGCNGVSKGNIIEAIQEKGCTSVQDIKLCTKASASCGGCKPLVADLLAYTLGADSMEAGKEGICSCTTLTRDEIVQEIRDKGLTTSKEVMNVLEWETTEGCSKCRPALNYYLGMVYPEEHVDESESRFVNERVHANIQNDGTFSVVPRIYGGVTSPQELKKIAEVAEKYNARMVKITGGQRIDLLGIKKEDLPHVWAELDMPSGYAYGKALRTVKTCVGNTFCRFGTQDSIQLGIDLEKRFERLNTPAKVKMAVSACPRSCAESTIKDFGVIGIEGGWELYVGGNGGVKVRASELLCKVKTDDEVLEWSGAFLQYYRENANWNERTSEWVHRVGLDSIKQALEKKEDREALVERIDKTLSLMKDPWQEIIQTEDLRNTFEPLTIK